MDKKTSIVKAILPKVIALSILFALSGCGLFNKNINISIQPEEYQAYFISLEDKQITPIQEVLKQEQVVADFWLETQDPEIGTMGDEFEGLPHKGSPTQVSVYTASSYKALKTIPSAIEWKDYIESKDINEGMVFLVKASSGMIYKVKLKAFDREEVKLVYKRLKEK